MAVQFLALGPLEVRNGGGEITLGGAKPRTLLAALLQNPRRVVSRDRLVDLIWDDDPPPSADALIHTYVSALRKAFAAAGQPETLLTRAPGYVLDIGHAESDLEQFQQHLAAARYAERRAAFGAAGAAYEKALGLWRAPAFTGVTAAFARSAAAELGEEQLAAAEGLARCLLQVGRCAEVVARMSRVTAEHPHREAPYGLLMRGLYATGRQGDALAVYQDVRRVLMADLGVEPGQDLREIHQEILNGTAAVPAAAAPSSARPPVSPSDGGGVPVPRLLPPDIGDFSARIAALEQVLAIGRSQAVQTSSPTVVISGFGGAGKSTLAVHAAHLLRDRFPDGQLFADFSGAEGEPDVREIIGRFAVALGAATTQLPSDIDERSALYRMHIAAKRLVIVLDNVSAEAQVRKLLPGTEGCLILITSRSRLTGLEGAEAVELEYLSEDASHDMLRDIVGPDRLASDPGAARALARLCGGIPLAIRTVGTKLLARPHWPLRALAARLGDVRRRLDELAAGDRAVRASLELTYAELDDDARRAFHLLTSLNMPDFAAWLAAPLLGMSLDDAEDVVERLVDLRLLDVVGIDNIGRVRYRFHDLVQIFGAERAGQEPADAVAAATTRALRLSLELVTASSWGRLYQPVSVPLERDDSCSVDARLLEEISGSAADWFAAETPSLVRMIERSHELGQHQDAVVASATMISPFAVRNDFDSWQRTHAVALSFARKNRDRRAETITLAGLGQMYYEKDDFERALEHYREACELAEQTGDDRARAVALVGIGTVCSERAEYESAHRTFATAAELADRLDDPALAAATQFGIGSVSRDRGNLAEATGALHRCVQLRRAMNDRRGEGQALRGVSLCHRAAGDCAEAAATGSAALEILRDAGAPRDVAYAQQSLVKAWIRQRRTADAGDALADALRVCEQHRDRFGIALITRTRGELALSLGEPRRAVRLLSTAYDMWGELQLDIWQARTLRDLAAAEVTDDPRLAQKHWSQALTIFTGRKAREAQELPSTSPGGWHDRVVCRPVIDAP